ncbi:MAG: DUF3822 family protein [Sediminibacterium sp.]|nr:MAG: hypothetical protein FD183_1663 [Chitinophagaceae bacterium]MDP1843805.1 DUF3822 family protein [Sediminibacterium sp.]TXT33926.1 MAG: hypothetical protein FD136_613 [Chitinophagaceae bacterium]
MARKKIGLYKPDTNFSYNHQLVVELGNDELVCLVKNEETGEIDGFELFSLDKSSQDDWNDIFYEIKSGSTIFNNTFKQVFCYFNVEESLLIPEKLLTATSAEDYLNLIFGESIRHEVKYEKLLATKVFINAYRVRKSIIELLNRQFIIFQTGHTYSNLLNDVMRRPRIDDYFLKIQFYSHHFIIAVWKEERFQLIQSYRYHSAEDILYFVLRITQQFDFDPAYVVLELSGMVDVESNTYTQLAKVFANIHLDAIEPDGIFKSAMDEYPAHYFTPFYKLAL